MYDIFMTLFQLVPSFFFKTIYIVVVFFSCGVIPGFCQIPLTLVDIFKYFPDLKEKMSWLNELSRYTFALSFLIIRLIIWPYISYDFIRGSVDLLQSGRAHSKFAVGFFLFANVFLTGLQFFWGTKIFGFLFKSGKKKDNKDAKSK